MISGLGFCFFTVMLSLIILFESDIVFKISTLSSSENKSGGHFHALISADQNHSRLARHLRDLPGVMRVEELSEEAINLQVNELFSHLEGKHVRDIMSSIQTRYVGLKVFFDDDLQERSVALIRDYMVRITGESNITFGPTMKVNESREEQSVFMTKNYDLVYRIIQGVSFLFWLCFTLFFSRKLRRYSYLTEQFQRKKHVAVKTFFSGFVSLIFTSFIICVAFSSTLNFEIEILLFILTGMVVSLLFLKQYQWVSDFD